MALRVGQILQGCQGRYQLHHALKGNTVFKARVLPNSKISTGWAVIKSADTEDEELALQREYSNYRIPEIASSLYIRSLHDIVPAGEDTLKARCLVLEWMDTDLRCMTGAHFRGNKKLQWTVSNTVLNAFEIFKSLQKIHTDINLNNILVSGLDENSPIAKVADLGNLVKEGIIQRCQSLPCRAPEVWKGFGCIHVSDVWSLGVTLARRLSAYPHFGPADKIIEGSTEAWCIAKIIRLIGPIGTPADIQAYREEFELAEKLAVMQNPDGTSLMFGGTLREQLEQLTDPPVSKNLIEFIQYLLVIDGSRRPTASDALRHSYIQSSIEDAP